MKRWFRENSLSVVLLVLFLIFWGGQMLTGYMSYNDDLQSHNYAALTFVQYLGSGAFIEATFENWESEFLQMSAYVILTIFLRQKGSAESKKIDGSEAVDARPRVSKNAVWAIRKGGAWSWLYRNSLSLAFATLFFLSFSLHAYGGARETSIENQQHGEQSVSTLEYMASSKFWFESFQNWQSEFLAVFAIVVLSIFLRQQGSPESKPVNTPHSLTGSE